MPTEGTGDGACPQRAERDVAVQEEDTRVRTAVETGGSWKLGTKEVQGQRTDWVVPFALWGGGMGGWGWP